MLNITSDMKQGQGLSKDRTYEATVVNNDDPMKLGRVTVKIAGVTDGFSDEHLPWAIPDFAHTGGASSKSGSLAIPDVGSMVSVVFEDGNIDFGRYSGYHVTKKTQLAEGQTNYPARVVNRLSNGALVVVDKKTNEVFIRNPGTTRIYIGGDVELVVAGNMQHIVKGNYNLTVEGDYNLSAANIKETADGSHDTKASAVHMSGDSVAVSASAALTAHGSAVSIEASGALALTGAPLMENSGGSAGDPGAAAVAEKAAMTEWPGIPGS
jgi:hypothetical protein